MKRYARLLPLLAAVLTGPAQAEVLPMSWTPPSGMPPGPIEGSSALLLKAPEGASMILETSGLEPGHAVTVWFVAIQSPQNCKANPCTPVEAMGMPAEMNPVAANAGGTVVDAEGRIRVQGFLPVGDVPGNLFGTTFSAPESSEYHLVVHDHGPLIPDLAADQISSYRGGCTLESVPPHYPENAVNDGEGGPNTCVTRQVALFVPAGDGS